MEIAPNLTSHERRLFAHYLLQSIEDRSAIIEAARRDPQTSGSLLWCYRWGMTA